MPHLRLKLLEGKTESQKQQLAQELVNTMQKVIGFGEESYSVAIEDFSYYEWRNDVYPNDIMKDEEKLYKKPGYTM
ncbi:MAG: 4-oxalocrotonate tautomerase [Pseudozobellia sp.]|mgnify:CR=1 FL=1|nr:4-oxalocrotonate tautomerase [Pseudozobellia sp.]MBG47877.1 4-oxalocrotonate tautomerase [Pseudozobellia sp.]|tara:strand:+ start:322 stop:549 length:228 start_codon:yes stop_codon:yes gene_type:complete